MAILWRVNPRTGRLSLASSVTQSNSSKVSGLVGSDELFGIVAPAETGQGSQTSDISASASAPAGATIQTGQGSQTSDAVFSVASDAAIQTGQGSQTSDVVATTPFVASVETGQGSQTSDASGIITSYQSIAPAGWWDAANETVNPGASFWQTNPRSLGLSFVSSVAQREASQAFSSVADGEAFTAVTWTRYEDGFGTHAVSWGSRTLNAGGDEYGLFGTATVYNLSQSVTVPGISSDEGFGTPNVEDLRHYVSCDGGQWWSFGTPSLENLNRTIYAQRIDPAGVGDPVVVGPRYITGATVGDVAEFGDNEIAGSRTVYPSALPSGSAFGTAYAAFYTRDVRPTSIQILSNQVPAVMIANTARTVETYSVDELDIGIGDPIIGEPPFDVIEYAGVGDTSEFGDLDTELAGTVRRIRAPSFLHAVNTPALGTPKIIPHTIHPKNVNTPAYGKPWVSNKIRYIDLSLPYKGYPSRGIAAGKIGNAWVSNWIRYLEPAGWDHSEVWYYFGVPPDGQLANVRHVSDGKLYPGSINDGAFGEPSLRFNYC